MASAFEINSDSRHEILDHTKSNPLRPLSSSSTSRSNNHLKTFPHSKKKSSDYLKFNDVSLRRTYALNSKGSKQIEKNNLYRLLMQKIKQQDFLSSSVFASIPATTNSLIQRKHSSKSKHITTSLKSNEFELADQKTKTTSKQNTKHLFLKNNLQSYQTRTNEIPARFWSVEKSPIAKQQSSFSSINDEHIGVIDDVDVVPLYGKSTLLTSFEAIGLVGVIFAAVVFACWIAKIIRSFVNKKPSSSIETLNIRNKSSNQTKQKKIISVFRKSFLFRRPVVVSKIMDTNTDSDQLNDRTNNDSNKSTPYFTPLGTFDDDRSRFEYPVPSPPISRSGGKLNSNEELLPPIPIASASADSVQNVTSKSKTSTTANATNNTNNFISTESPGRRFSSERRPCSPAWAYMAHLLTTNPVSNKSQYDTYDNLFAAGSTPLSSAISAFSEMHSTRPSPPASASAAEGCTLMNRQSCRSPKVYDKEGDKENAIPTKTIHKQQNSPLPLEVIRLAATKFSFSPKDINDKSSSSSSAAEGRCAVKSSPTLSSAGYTKNGDYFKFPEVDLSPGITNKINAYHYENQNENRPEIANPLNNLVQHDRLKISSATTEAQATRRARLKSISLDSEGAKLVEDNLGVPVEELIEMTTPTSLMPSDFISNSPNKNNAKNISNLKNISISKSERDETREDIDDSCCFDEVVSDGYYVQKSNKSNNLSLKVMWYNDVNQNAHREPIIRTPPPKTPTLGKTKQKAISFDSSDSSKFLSSSSSSSISRGLHDQEQNDTSIENNMESSPSKAVSLMHISSLSMPGTPKRNFSPNKKYNHAANRIHRSKQRQLSSNITLTPSSPSLLSFDHNISGSKCAERQGFILKLDSFNENCVDDVDYGHVELGAVDDDTDGDNYFINFDDSITATAASNTKLLSENETLATKKLSPDYLIGSNLQTQKSATALSLSNSNLKTLPEVMTLSDFSVSRKDDEIYEDTLKASSAVAVAVSTSGGKQLNVLSSRSTARSSLLQRRGSNHSLTLNLNESYGSLNKGMSASNCSLSSNPQYNLSNSIYNLTGSKQQAVLYKGNSIGIPSTHIHNGNNLINPGSGFGGNPGNSSERKNLLQRRGSNTSLTLNIHGSSYVHLNRFKSHSSLNITSHPPQQQNLFKIQQQHYTIKDPILCENSSNSKTSSNKKGLLERRGSNASLTINLQCNALAVSNLRGSACSLSSINTNQLEEEYGIRGNQENEFLDADTTAANPSCVGQQRKFFSSENLNSLNNRSQYTKLNQTHMRNSTKTCFGSVSDLNNYSQLPISFIDNQQETTLSKTIHINQDKLPNLNSSNSNLTLSKTKQVISESFITNFEQSNLCSCTGLRNITTRPLSPQTTSEDFKMYLANVQLLQNASNVLDGYDLMKLNYVFEKSYSDDENLDHSNAFSGCGVETFDEKNKWKIILSSFYQIDLPDENEQKRLIRSLHQEFWDLPTNHQEKPMVFGSQSKNRYKSILPNEHSRVQLIAEEGCIEDPYINANYIKGPDYVQKSYIATQGPLPNTIYDFWLMIYQNICKYDEHQKYIGSSEPYCMNKSSSKLASTPIQFNKIIDSSSIDAANRQQLRNKRQKIIMLTNFIENNRQKCATYFPINENDIFLITYKNDEIKNNDINIFYNKYFKKHETSSSNYDTFEIEINDKKIIDYLPKVNYFIVKNNGIILKNGFSIRQLQCLFCCNKSNKSSSNINCNSESGNGSSKEGASNVNDKRIQTIHSFSSLHYWYPDWPDHRSPSDISVLLEISQHMLTWDNLNDQPLPVIHCSAGIGRTGCMAAILNAICQMRASFPLKSINAYQHDEQTASPTTTTTTTAAMASCNNSNNIQSSMSDADNLQSFSSQSFPYSNNSSSDNVRNSNSNLIKNIQSPAESNVDKNRIQCIFNAKDEISSYSNSNSSCSFSKAQSKNKMYCESGPLATLTTDAPIRKSPSIHVDILGIVCNLRLQRGGMVQNSEQYELIHRAMCLYLKRVLKLIYEAQI
ncbi:uncharacterized protein LOC129953186 [Eupeodes corollae]|uniref:uncharacterized protein LOC129953186 n=1 Tax=Eupeodes corollae TaxID=290404 RepID=UPI002492F33E|nr:uncharacterized protein LOC129953186 [Eupeodes corollae]